MSRNFATNPRTKREALELILYAGRKSHLCAFSLSRDSKYDAIGACLTPQQRAWLRKHGVEDATIDTLVKQIGLKNLTAMTGMSAHEAKTIQVACDSSYDTAHIKRRQLFLNQIRDVLKNGEGRIGGWRFTL